MKKSVNEDLRGLSMRIARVAGGMLVGVAALVGGGCEKESKPPAEVYYGQISPDTAMKEWLLVGPIPAQEGEVVADVEQARKMGYGPDLLEKVGGEAGVKPQPGQSLTARGGEYKWKHHKSEDGTIDLLKALGKKDFVVGYAAAVIDSSEDESRIVGLGSDDAVRVWLNGELVHEHAEPRALTVDDDVFPVKLRKGKNQLLVKVVNDQGEWSFSFRFLSPELVSKRLFTAAAQGNDELVKKLVEMGVAAESKSKGGVTAAQIAKMRGNDSIAEFLVSKGAPPPQAFDAAAVVTGMLEELSAKDEPGVAVLVARDGKALLSHGVGMANVKDGVAITPTTKFRIGSITKQFTASAILKLQEEGKLKVTDKLSKHFHDFPRGDEVTIHHLLTHTSGIKSYTSKPDFMEHVAEPATNEEMIDSFKNEPYDFDPGSKFSYNNSGYFLLGVIVEKVSGKPYGDYLRETFFEPLGMHDTDVHSSTAEIKNQATGYTYEGGKPKEAVDWDMSRAGGAGALYSTAEDLMRWSEGVFGGKVLSKESLAAAFTPVKLSSDEEPMMEYGYGWMIGEKRGLKTISHGGGLNGWNSEMLRFVDQNTTVVVLHNALPPKAELAPAVVAEWAADAFLWQEMKPRSKHEVDKSVDPKTFTQYVGRYDFMGAALEVALEGDQLTAQLTGQPRFPIFPAGGDKFFWKVVDAQIEFLKNDKGQVDSARHTQGNLKFVVKRLPEEKIVEVDEKTLDRYIGKYEYKGLGVLTVRCDDGKLFAQMTGQPEFEIYAKAPNEFFWKVVVAEIKFVSGDDGKVTKAVHKQGGSTIDAKKIE